MRGRRTALANTAGVLVTLVMIFPVYWMVLTALKPPGEVLNLTPRFWPSHLSLTSFLAAVAIARFRFYGRRAFIFAIVVVQMVPLNAMIIPIYLLLNQANQVNKLSGVVLTYLTFVLPFTVWTLRGFVVNVPAALEEAAMVDGCTRTQAFRRIVLPLVFPGLVATSIYALIQSW